MQNGFPNVSKLKKRVIFGYILKKKIEIKISKRYLHSYVHFIFIYNMQTT